jgi:hypothetical protein
MVKLVPAAPVGLIFTEVPVLPPEIVALELTLQVWEDEVAPGGAILIE